MAAPNDYFTTPRKGTSLTAAMDSRGQPQPQLSRPNLGGLSAQLQGAPAPGGQRGQQQGQQLDPAVAAAAQQLHDVRKYLEYRERTGL